MLTYTLPDIIHFQKINSSFDPLEEIRKFVSLGQSLDREEKTMITLYSNAKIKDNRTEYNGGDHFGSSGDLNDFLPAQ